jgi:hypothetical protein
MQGLPGKMVEVPGFELGCPLEQEPLNFACYESGLSGICLECQERHDASWEQPKIDNKRLS